MLKRNLSAQKSNQNKKVIDNICNALNQKEKIIALLQNQLIGFNSLRSDYQHLKDKKNTLVQKCDKISLQLNLNKQKNKSQLTVSLDDLQNSKSKLQNLQLQLKNKNNYLAQLFAFKQQQLKNIQNKNEQAQQMQQLKQALKQQSTNCKEQQKRLLENIKEAKHQLSNKNQKQNKIRSTIDKIRKQVLMTQNYMRKLGIQEAKVNQQLDDCIQRNDQLGGIIQQLKQCQIQGVNKCKLIKQDSKSQQLKTIQIQSQLGRIHIKQTQKNKLYIQQNNKAIKYQQIINKNIKQQQKLTNINKQIITQNQQYSEKNLQVCEINDQLKDDLSLCLKHLENLQETNNKIQCQLQVYGKSNIETIKKLQKVMKYNEEKNKGNGKGNRHHQNRSNSQNQKRSSKDIKQLKQFKQLKQNRIIYNHQQQNSSFKQRNNLRKVTSQFLETSDMFVTEYQQ